MKKQLVITDLTRMYRGMVCIAGYDINEHTCVRLILPPPGMAESLLYLNGKLIIFPFAVIEVELTQHRPQPPHVEDYIFNPRSLRFISTYQDRAAVLQWSLSKTVEEIFGQPVLSGPGYFVKDCQGLKSLGTLLPQKIIRVCYEQASDDSFSYRMQFVDSAERFYSLKIVDLTWNYYCTHLRSTGLEPSQIADRLTDLLKSRQVFLRVGLGRGWAKFPDRCYLQLNAIYSFPDYLEGKVFSEFV